MIFFTSHLANSVLVILELKDTVVQPVEHICSSMVVTRFFFLHACYLKTSATSNFLLFPKDGNWSTKRLINKVYKSTHLTWKEDRLGGTDSKLARLV